MTEYDFTADWSPATLRLALDAAEAAASRNFSAAMRFAGEAERLAAELAKIRGTRTVKATSIHREKAALRAARIRDLRGRGVTIRRIADEVGIDQRSVSRVLNPKKAP